MTTKTTDTELFDKVRAAVDDALLIAWDGCHKIYLAMDQEQADWFRSDYPYVVQDSPDRMLDVLGRWWDKSCGLKFISAVTTNHANPNLGYVDLISQFEDDEDYDA